MSNLQNLSDTQILSSMLRVSEEKAQYLINKNGGLRNLVLDNPKLYELLNRFMSSTVERGRKITNVSTVKDYIKLKLRDKEHEVFACLFLDSRHRIIQYKEMFKGTIDSASVYPREVVKEALKLNTAAVIFAHNHPSGVAEPSDGDKRITDKLKDALTLVGVRVLDHFVIGDDVVSFAERGLI